MRIDLNCACCGSNRFSMDQAESDHSLIRCLDCGHLIGTLGNLKEQVAAEVLRRTEYQPGSLG